MAIVLVTDYGVMKAALLAWLEQQSGAAMGSAIFLNQEADRPAKPYATIQVIADNIRTGTDDVRPEYDGGVPALKYRTVGMREMTAQVQIYTDPATSVADIEAADRLNQALITLDHPSIDKQFNDANISILGHTSVIRLDEQLGERWERRASADLRIMYTAESIDDGSFGEWVESVQIPTVDNGNLTANI